MKLFITAVPLFDSEMSVIAYSLEFQSSTSLFDTAKDYKSLDGAMYSPGVEVLNKVGLEPFTGGKPIFFPVNHFMLLTNFESNCSIPPKSAVCVLSKDMPMDKVYVEKCQELNKKGFSIAIEGIEHSRQSEPIFRMAKYIILDSRDSEFMSMLRLVRLRYPYMEAVVKYVEHSNKFNEIKIVPNALFSGRFYIQPITKGATKISPLKLNTLQILKLIGEDDYDLDAISKIIARDVSLSISLLKFINSPMIGIVSRVNSIQGAVALLGQQETRKWVTVAVSRYLAEDKPSEIAKLSLVRAKFAENLAIAFELGIHANALFLMGLFSLLDIILEKPMAEAVTKVFMDNNVKNALVNGEGKFAPVLKLMYAYEQGDWKGVCYIVVMYELNVDKVCTAFIDALFWYRSLLDSIEQSDK